MNVIETAFLKILNMSITASYVILAVLLIRLFLRKIPKAFSYVLWSAVAFRLVCPVSFSSIVSIFNFNLFNMTIAQRNGHGAFTYVPYNIGYMDAPKLTVGIPAANTMINKSLVGTALTQDISPIQIAVSAAAILWCAGIIVMLGYSIAAHKKVKRCVSNAVILEQNVFECDGIPSPFVSGLLNPRIYIPFRMKRQEQEYILRHEQYHIRRLDYLIKPLFFLLLVVHWFNPLVWIAYLYMGRDMEMSCDEKVLSDMGMSIKRDYSMSLLEFSTKGSVSLLSPLAFGESGVKLRIKNILKFKRPTVWLGIVSAILCIGVIGACAANPETQQNNEEVSASSVELLQTKDISDVYGYYEFGRDVYTNLMSSFLAVKGYMPYYEIHQDALWIIDSQDGSAQKFSAVFEKKVMDKDDFKALFEKQYNIPDISRYGECYQYAVFTAPSSPEYRLYIMDDEVWLAQFNGNTLWSIYELVRRVDIESATVTSGHNSASALIYPSSTEVRLQEIRDGLTYLEIEPSRDICPFHVYAGGNELYGHYEIYDAEDLRKLDFVSPSGLEPQTYILENAVPGRRYIIVLSIGNWVGDHIYGTRIMFGVSLP